MRAIVVQPEPTAAMEPLVSRRPAPMLPLVDRPFLQHVVEALIELGVREIDFVLGAMAGQLESFLGDGGRWGSAFRFHRGRDTSRIYGELTAVVGLGPRERAWLAHADQLPVLAAPLERLDADARTPVLLYGGRDHPDSRREWTGWGLFSGADLDALPAGLSREGLADYFTSLPERAGGSIEGPRPFGVRSADELLAGQRVLLDGGNRGWRARACERRPGIWMGSNVRVHPTAHLVAPVYVGENSRVGAGVRLGPYAVLEQDCIVDDRTEVEETVVLAGSYVGRQLELRRAVVDASRLVNVDMATDLTVPDEFILGNLYAERSRAPGSLPGRGCANVLSPPDQAPFQPSSGR